MRRAIKEFVLKVIGICGIHNVMRNLTVDLPRILMYHAFSDTHRNDHNCTSAYVFRKQLEYIKKYYKPMKLCELIESRISTGAYPSQSVVITVDDTYANFYEWAFPLLRELKVPATVFVVSRIVESNEWMWFDRLRFLYEIANSVSLTDKEKLVDSLLKKLKRLTTADRDIYIRELIKEMNVNIPSKPISKYESMSWEQLQEISDSGLVEIGSHTCTHPFLMYSNKDKSWDEVVTSRLEIHDRLGVPVNSFCYPYGLPGDYGPEHVEMIQRAGYLCATASHFGLVKINSSMYTLPRINCHTDMLRFRKYIDAVEYFQRESIEWLVRRASIRL